MNNTTATMENNVALKAAVQMKFEDLMTEKLQGVENTEVVVSITTVPPHTTLPKHWHPGEEFAYILDGSIVLIQDGKADEYYRKGDVGKVPLKQVHTVRTDEESATILIFRVHELGQPGRILVE
jgi:quercetin dioxygenase-like cupin family protein